MALILCEVSDAGAFWAAARLQARGCRVDFVFAPALGAATRWEHRVGFASASVAITLADGRIISSEQPVPILNRMTFVPLDHLRAVAGTDYGYAVQEMFALHLSWLHAWPATVLNRPTPQGLCGNYRHPAAWVKLAAETGLPTSVWVQNSADSPELIWSLAPAEATAIVVEGTVILPPALPEQFAEGCRALAAVAGSALLGIDFTRNGDDWLFTGASPMPNLELGGEPLIDALAAALQA